MIILWLIFGLIMWLWPIAVIYLIVRWLIKRKAGPSQPPQSSSKEEHWRIVISELKALETDPRWANYRSTVVKIRKSYERGLGVEAAPGAKDKSAEASLPARERVKFRWTAEQNINLLLYLGAFLVVVGLGVFVAFNWQQLSGFTKMLFISGFSLIFYFLGLYLYKAKPIFKPAGFVFFLIGLVTLPLLGVAYYNFLSPGQHLAEIWLSTSAAVFLLYSLSLALIQRAYVTAATAAAAASLVSSITYWFSLDPNLTIFTLPAAAAILYLVSKLVQDRGYLVDGLRPTAIAVALFSSVVSVARPDTLFVLGVNLVLAGIFYLVAAFIDHRADWRESLLVLGLVSLPLGSWLLASFYDLGTQAQASILVGFALVYAAIYMLALSKEAREGRALATVAATLPVFAYLQVLDIYPDNLSMSFVALLISLAVFMKSRRAGFLLLAIPYSGIVSYLIHTSTFFPASPQHYLGYTFLLLFVAWYLVGFAFRATAKTVRELASLGAGGFAVFALAFSLGHSLTLFFVSVILAIVFAGIAELEENPKLYLTTVIVSYIALFAGLDYQKAEPGLYGYWVMGLSGFWFVLGLAIKEWSQERGQAMRYTALIGQGLSGFITPEYSEFVSILSFYILAGLLAVEAVVAKVGKLGYVASAVFMIALERHLGFLNFSETQVFTVPLAAYFAVLAVLQARRGDDNWRDIFTGLSLAALTIPLFFQSAEPTGQIYAIALGIESLILVGVGVTLSYRLVTAWGVVALIINVFWQVREFLFALPQWVIYLVVGLLLLSAAVYLLKERAQHEGEPKIKTK